MKNQSVLVFHIWCLLGADFFSDLSIFSASSTFSDFDKCFRQAVDIFGQWIFFGQVLSKVLSWIYKPKNVIISVKFDSSCKM